MVPIGAIAVVLTLAAAPQSAAPTELVIRAVDESGQPARLTRADVYFDDWGGGEPTHLRHRTSFVRIGLDRASVCAVEPSLCANHPTFSARILLEAEGLAPISSNLFDWMTGAADVPGVPPVEIRFPGAAPLRFRSGTRRDITIRFRSKQPRTLRVVDPAGAPVRDASVTVKNFFADTNHMGAVEGETLVQEQGTDAHGEVAIPDGDIVYGLHIVKAHWFIVNPKPRIWPNQIAQRIAGASLTVVMRPHVKHPLLLKFERDGRPVADLTVSACVTPCGGACCGSIGSTDAFGNLTIRDFYPEEYDRVLVPAGEEPYKSIWEIDPRKIRNPRKRLSVTLPR
jgi:hypothetical protein